MVHLLAFVGGFIDSAGYLRLLGVFTSSITGNLVVATASVASLRGVVCRSCVCVTFFLSGGVASAISLRIRTAHNVSQRLTCCFIFGLEIAFIIASWIIGIEYDAILLANENIDQWTNVLIACLLGASMGFHNVAAKEAITNCPPTTVMTSTMINVAQNLSNTIEYGLAKHSLLRLHTSSVQTAEQTAAMVIKYVDSLNKFQTTAKPLLSFIVGCIIGAITMNKGSWHCFIIPCVGIFAIIIDTMLQQHALTNAALAAQRLQASLDLAHSEDCKSEYAKVSVVEEQEQELTNITYGSISESAPTTTTEFKSNSV